jgi:predicted RNA binding protein YcfA (HicA-like mRNA interferase family)
LTGEATYVSCLTFKDLQASLHIFKKAGKPTLIPVPVHPGNAMKTGTHRAFLKESGIKSGE